MYEGPARARRAMASATAPALPAPVEARERQQDRICFRHTRAPGDARITPRRPRRAALPAQAPSRRRPALDLGGIDGRWRVRRVRRVEQLGAVAGRTAATLAGGGPGGRRN